MSNAKHTPWTVKNAGKKGGVRVMDSGNVLVAETPCATAEDYEHARLIAAAPVLLAALERVAALNPDAGEIGAGMLKTIVSEARSALASIGRKDVQS